MLAGLGGEKGTQGALDWFFNQKPERGAFGGGRESILGQLELADPYRYRRLVARIIRDERLFTLGPPSTRALVRAVQGYSGLAVADEPQIGDSYGIDEAQRNRRPAYLAEWHRQLRQTIEGWDAPR